MTFEWLVQEDVWPENQWAAIQDGICNGCGLWGGNGIGFAKFEHPYLGFFIRKACALPLGYSHSMSFVPIDLHFHMWDHYHVLHLFCLCP